MALGDFMQQWGDLLKEEMDRPADSWIKDYLGKPVTAFDLGEEKAVTVTTAIAPGHAAPYPWKIDPVPYPEFPSIDYTKRPMFTGIEIIESAYAVERYEDWSEVRSPARAERRRKRGFRQNVVMRERPCSLELNGVLYIHPELMRQVRRQAEDRVRSAWDRCFLSPTRA